MTARERKDRVRPSVMRAVEQVFKERRRALARLAIGAHEHCTGETCAACLHEAMRRDRLAEHGELRQALRKRGTR